MNPSAWDRAKSLLAAAAVLPVPEREPFVEEHCSDPALRREVLELLASPAPLTAIVTAGTLEPGVRLGTYVIDRLIGKGGMGEVYEALDSNLQRRVAIKVLPRPFIDEPERQARFRREAQILAALNHPNIAQIHGFEESTEVAATGRPSPTACIGPCHSPKSCRSPGRLPTRCRPLTHKASFIAI